MTSATGWKNRWSSRPGRAHRRGLTLLELLASLVILALLAGLGVVNFVSFAAGGKLQEGALRFETALRLARATAAHRGRRVRLRFQPGKGTAVVLWEPRPLAEPGQFVQLPASWSGRLPDESIRTTRCRLSGPSAYQTLVMKTTHRVQEGNDLQPVTFYPDGSSDSAVIELRSTAEDEALRALIQLDGLNNQVTTRILQAEQVGEYFDGQED